MTDETDTSIRHGTENVFADLGFPDPKTHLLKANLIGLVASIVRDKKLTQAAAARRMGISQHEVSRLLKGQFRDISIERIMRMLILLGCEIDIVIKPEVIKPGDGELKATAIRFPTPRP